MKFFLFLMSFVIVVPAHAAINPDLVICERYGFEMSVKVAGDEEYVFCKLPDGSVCAVEDVYSGFCNGEALPFLDCVEEGEHVFSEFEQCCEGSVPYLKKGYSGQPSCKKINALQEFPGDAVDHPVISSFLIVLGVGLITGFLVRRKKRKLKID